MKRLSFLSLLGILCLSSSFAVKAAPPAALTAKGAKFTETKGVVTQVDLPDLSTWSDADLKSLTEVSSLQKLNFGKGFNDHQLSLVTSLPEVNAFVSNGGDFTDEGVKMLAKFPKLQTVAFFHPSKNFTGSGLAALADLKSFDNLTVGGTNTFGDAGMVALGKLTGMKNLRVYHSDVTNTGLQQLKNLKNLTSLLVGQRLSLKPPVALCDDTMDVLVTLSALESLSLNEARLKYESLTKLKALKHLKRLTLESIDLTSSEVERLNKDLPGVQIKFTAPNEAGLKRINGLFGEKK